MAKRKHKYVVYAGVSKGNGNQETQTEIVVGTKAEAEEALWDMLQSLGVETAIVRDDEEEYADMASEVDNE